MRSIRTGGFHWRPCTPRDPAFFLWVPKAQAGPPGFCYTIAGRRVLIDLEEADILAAGERSAPRGKPQAG